MAEDRPSGGTWPAIGSAGPDGPPPPQPPPPPPPPTTFGMPGPAGPPPGYGPWGAPQVPVQRGRRFRLRAVILAGLGGLVLGAAVVGGLGLFAMDSEVFGPGEVVGRHDRIAEAAGAPAVGDCLDTFPEEADLTTIAEVVECDLQHGSEVIGIVTMPDAGEVPGGDDLDFFADDACRIVFADYVGEAYDDSDLAFGAVPPTGPAWREGDRALYCLLDADTYRDGRGSARDSAA
jgi:hypothetical protein